MTEFDSIGTIDRKEHLECGRKERFRMKRIMTEQISPKKLHFPSRIFIILCLLILTLTFSTDIAKAEIRFTADTNMSSDDEEGDTENKKVYYKGVATGSYNVRTGPGASYDLVMFQDVSVQVKAEEEVLIIREKAASDGTPWYYIHIKREGKTVKGYTSSTGITKTGETITPTPKPTAVPTPTPTLAPTKEVTPTSPAIDVVSDKSQGSGFGGYLLWIVVAIVLAAVLGITMLILRQPTKKGHAVAADKVDRLKRMNLEDQDGRLKNAGTRRKPEIRKLAGEPPRKEEYRKDVYMKPEVPIDITNIANNFYDEPKPQGDVKTNAMREVEEKKSLRAAIERLKERDIVIHQYFGEGEVYDNSDVKLLEVRFGNDVRFLNKDSLVSKKLLEICDEDQMLSRKKASAIKRSGRKEI